MTTLRVSARRKVCEEVSGAKVGRDSMSTCIAVSEELVESELVGCAGMGAGTGGMGVERSRGASAFAVVSVEGEVG